MPDAEELVMLRAIYDHPDEDVPRLQYADWLDEHDSHDQAEFIRLQIAKKLKLKCLKPYPREDSLACYIRLSHYENDPAKVLKNWCRVCASRFREKQLLDSHRKDWLPKCMRCNGSRFTYTGPGGGQRSQETCTQCNGTGHAGECRRGFVERVPVRMKDVLESNICPGCRGESVGKIAMCLMCDNRGKLGEGNWQPTGKAKDLLAAWPTVRELWCVDREPLNDSGDRFGWLDCVSDDRITAQDRLPNLLWEKLEGWIKYAGEPVLIKWYPTADDANTALARALWKVFDGIQQ